MGEPYVRRVAARNLNTIFGPTLLFDDFEDLFKWSGSGTGADWTVEKDDSDAYNGSASLHLKTRTTDPAANDYVRARRYIVGRQSGKYRISFRAKITAKANLSTLLCTVEWDNVSSVYRSEIFYNRSAGEWKLNDIEDTQDIEGSTFAPQDDTWFEVFIEIDLDDQKYRKLGVNGQIFDISEFEMETDASGGVDSYSIYFDVRSAGETPPEVHIDDVLIEEIQT